MKIKFAAVIAGVMVLCQAARAVIVTNVTWNSRLWYVDVTTAGPTAYVTMRADASQPTSDDFTAMTLQATNLPYDQVARFAGKLDCRSVQYYDDAKTILGCGSAGVSVAGAAGELPTQSADTFVCVGTYATFDSRLQESLSGAGPLIAQPINQSQAWSAAELPARISGPTLSSVIDSACTLASLVTTNDPLPATNAFIETWPQFLVFTNTAWAGQSFTVRNIGGDVLSGTVTVPEPFVIMSGSTYNLRPDQSQKVVVAFRPHAAGSYSQNVTLTGGRGTSVALRGITKHVLAPPSNVYARPAASGVTN